MTDTAELISEDDTPALPADLAGLAADLARAAETRAGAYAANTKETYVRAWGYYTDYLTVRGLDPFELPQSVRPEHAALAWMATVRDVYAPNSLATYLAGIAKAYRQAGVPFDRGLPEVAEFFLGLKREAVAAGRVSRKRRSLSLDEMRAMSMACGSGTARAARDRAVLLLGFAGALRRSELAALERRHVAETPRGITVFVAASKTDRAAEGAYLGLARCPDPLLCPADAWGAWMAHRDDGWRPAFVKVARNDAPVLLNGGGLTPRAVYDIVVRLAREAGLAEPERVGAHSLRAAFVTNSVRAGVTLEQTMVHSRHKSHRVAWSYVRDLESWRDNVVERIWGEL